VKSLIGAGNIPLLSYQGMNDHSAAHPDFLGAVFLMLSRYEEMDESAARDAFGRYPMAQSALYKMDCVTMPLADLYAAHLLDILGLKPLAKAQYSLRVSCDVDRPYHPGVQSFKGALRRAAGALINQRSPKNAYRAFSAYRAYKNGRGSFTKGDPYFTFDWMMDQAEAQNLCVTFHFIAGGHHPFDACYTMDEPMMKTLTSNMAARGHKLGLHPSFMAGEDAAQFHSELDVLCAATDQSAIDVRQHYLRWFAGKTSGFYDARVVTDSSLGYAEHVGFRCGTARPFQLYDLEKRCASHVVEYPLHIMDASLYGANYMALDLKGEAPFGAAMHIVRWCRVMNGVCSVLWHNSSLTGEAQRRFFTRLLREAAS
jgi:hypothetical protein